MTAQEIILTVGPLGTILLLAFVVLWVFTKLRVALAFLGGLIGLVALAVGITFFWTWVAGVVT